MKHKVEIQWSEDEFDCETCGGIYARGAVVQLDGKIILDKPAIAACFGSQEVDDIEVYQVILKNLGCEVIETGDLV